MSKSGLSKSGWDESAGEGKENGGILQNGNIGNNNNSNNGHLLDSPNENEYYSSGGSGSNSPRISSGNGNGSSSSSTTKMLKSSTWRAASHIGSVVDDWPMYSSQPMDYILGAPIGFGASSVVYEASFQPLNGRACAVKVIDLEVFGRDLAELRRETQLMSLSKHPNVLRVRGCWVGGTKLHIATRLMNAGSLFDIMRFSFPDGLEETVIATALKQALQGLNYLHINGWLHRDLKAANMLVDDDGTVLLGDFGVGVYLTETGKHINTANGTGIDDSNKADSLNQAARKSFVGTPCWMAPEVVERKSYDAKADIWSFGITALELSSGRAPHSRLPPIKVLMKTLQDEPPKLDRVNGAFKYSKLFDDFIKQCLQKDPSKRPTAERLLQHGFFKQAKSKKYLVSALLAGLPPLSERQEKRRAMSIASLHNIASWDFGSRLTTPAVESGDPFSNFSGVIASPRGSVRSSGFILPSPMDGEHSAGIRLSRPPSTEFGPVPPPGSWNKKQLRAQRVSVSFHVDETHELEKVDESMEASQKNVGAAGDITAPSSIDESATESSKTDSVDVQPEPEMRKQLHIFNEKAQREPKVTRLSKLFKRT